MEKKKQYNSNGDYGYWISPDNGSRYTFANDLDGNGNPNGGYAAGMGLSINWQKGPLQENKPNGAFLEDVVQACMMRLDFYQNASDGKFACGENAEAISHLRNALHVMRQRTARRRAQGVEGKHVPHDSTADAGPHA